MSRQIVNTAGQGKAASDALKTAIGSAVIAIVVLLIFYFMDGPNRAKPAAFAHVPATTITQSL